MGQDCQDAQDDESLISSILFILSKSDTEIETLLPDRAALAPSG